MCCVQLKVLPLMIIHGWPGSFVEFYKLIPLLTTPSPQRDFVFEVVCPSIPGFGFSESPHKKGTKLTHFVSKELNMNYVVKESKKKVFLLLAKYTLDK